MNTSFGEIQSNLSELYDAYIKQKNEIKEKLLKISLHEFFPNYSQTFHKVYSTDGSFISLWKSPLNNIYIGAVRIGYIEQTYIPKEKKYKEICNAKNDYLYLNFENFINDKYNTYESSLSVKDVLKFVMESREKQMLYTFASQSENEIIMVDGSLIEPYQMIRKENILLQLKKILGDKVYADIISHSTIKDLIDICNKNNHILVGVVKDSKKILFENIMRYEKIFKDVIKMQHLNPNKLYYFNIPKSIFKSLQTPILEESPFESIFAKLHANALKWHRIDYLKNSHDLETDILPSLANYSLYNRYLGTPRAPQVCDSIAVEVRQRKEKILQELYMILQELGFSKNEIFYGETDVDGESFIQEKNGHDYYDLNRKAKKNVNFNEQDFL